MDIPVYVTGCSGRFPGCSSVSEFWENVSEGNELFPDDNVCDAVSETVTVPVHFLGHEEKNPLCVVMLQVVYEALCDAGYCQEDLQDSDTGLYVCYNDNNDGEECKFVEKIISVFGFRGATVEMKAVDRSSSLVALDLALNAIRSGSISRALVLAGNSMCLGAVLLESRDVSPQGGALQLLGSGVTTGGGVEAQIELFESVCIKCSVDPHDVDYVESHHDFCQIEGVNDEDSRRQEELNALDQVYGWKDISSAPSIGRTSLDDSFFAESQQPLAHNEESVAAMHLRQEKIFVFSSKATSISSGATWTLPLPVNADSATIRYKFNSEDGDMIFAMYYVTEKKKMIIVPQRLFDFAQDETSGQFDVRGPGTLFLRWANTHTWYGEKILSYSVEINEVEHPTLDNPQQHRIEESMRTLSAFSPAAYSQKESLTNLEAYIHKFQQSDVLVVEDEYVRTKYQLIKKLEILKSLKSLLRRASSSVQDIEHKRVALGIRILNSYQLSEVLAFLEPNQTHLVCKYWKDVCVWDKKMGLPPTSDYIEGSPIAHPSVGIDEELEGIIMRYVDSEINIMTPVSVSRPSVKSVRSSQAGAIIGSLRSNGHRSLQLPGLFSLIKVIGIYTEEKIPASNRQSAKLSDPTLFLPFLAGRLHMLHSSQLFANASTSVIAVNSLSRGGSNVHILCCSGGLRRDTSLLGTRYICGSSKSALEQYVKANHVNFSAWQKHLRQSNSLKTFPWRGIIHDRSTSNELSRTLIVDALSLQFPKKKVAFCFAGHGIEWQSLALQLWENNARFKDVLLEGCSDLPIDLSKYFSMQNLEWIQLQLPDFGITLVQIGLTILLRDRGINPDVIVGHGIGEIACSFADGCTSVAEACRIAFHRCQLGQSMEVGGLMLEVGLDLKSGAEFVKSYPSCVIACHNSPAEVTFSGKADEIRTMEESLKAIGVATALLSTGEVSYHSMLHTLQVDSIKTVIKDAISDMSPKRRSSKWISTSCDACMKSIPHHCYYPTVNYEVNNICNVVDFASVLPELSSNTFILEIGSIKMQDIFSQSSASGENGNIEYRSIAGGDVTVRELADQLWLEGISLTFPRNLNIVSMRNRLSIDWGRNQKMLSSVKDEQRTLDNHIAPMGEASASKVVSLAPQVTTELFGVETKATSLGTSAVTHKRVPIQMCNSISVRGYGVRQSCGEDMTSLRWVENFDTPDCEVKFCGINEVDIERFHCHDEVNCRGVGWEFSGVREDGVSVMGIIPHGSLATHVNSAQNLLWVLPSYISFEEAATIPVDYCAAYYILDMKAGVKPGQTVLIGDISNGVSQAVYKICRSRECPVLAFCAQGQRDLIHKQLHVDIDSLIEVTDTDAMTKIVQDRTQGEGVDVAIQSVGQLNHADCLRMVRKFGHFFALGSSNHGSVDDVRTSTLRDALENSVSIHFTDAYTVVNNASLWTQLHAFVADGFLAGEVIPNQFKVFDEVETALNFAGAQVEGVSRSCFKSLLRVGDKLRLFADGRDGAEKVTRMFRTFGTHLIVGGEKDIAELVSFLLRRGSTKIVVICDQHMQADFQDDRVSFVNCDLTSLSACEDLIKEFGMDDFKGIWCLHEAGGTGGQVADNWLQKFKNLEQCSRTLISLDHFVVWSACRVEEDHVASGYNWIVEDTCQRRKSLHLPAVIIQVKLQAGVTSTLIHLDDILYCENAVVTVY